MKKILFILFVAQFILAPYIIKGYGANLVEDNYDSIIVSREKPKIKRISACSNGISIIYYLIGPQNGPPKKKFLEST